MSLRGFKRERLYENVGIAASAASSDSKGGESPHEYAEAEELFPEVASSSDNKHSHSEYPLYDDVLPAQTSHLRSEAGRNKATATATFESTSKHKIHLSHSQKSETERRVEKVAQQPQASVQLEKHHLDVGGTVSGYESDWSGKYYSGCSSEYPRRAQRPLVTPVEEDSLTPEVQDNVGTAHDSKSDEVIIPCFTATYGKEGGKTKCSTITLEVPPFSVSEPTRFSSHIVLRLNGTGIADPTLPIHYPLSPTLSLSPHDAKFQQKVILQFPFSADPKDWLLRLLYCSVNGNRWEVLVDVLQLNNSATSSVMVMPHRDTVYDPGTGSILVDHFCMKRWVGVPIHSTAKNRIWCALFGRPLETPTCKWEVILRCFSPCIEVYRYTVDRTGEYEAEIPIGEPLLLAIGLSGDVRIAFEKVDSSWQLDEGIPEIFVPAKSTFWNAESPMEYQYKFIIRRESATDYVRAAVSVKHIDNDKVLQSVLLDGRVPIRAHSSWSNERTVYNFISISDCSGFAIGNNNQVTNVHACPTTIKSCKSDVVECGQKQGVLFIGFSREGAPAPLHCMIFYMGNRDVRLTKSSEGTRTADEFVLQTWKPSWPYPDTVTVLIRNIEGDTVGCCWLSMGVSDLPIAFSVMVTSTGRNEGVVEENTVDMAVADEQSRADNLRWQYSSARKTPRSSTSSKSSIHEPPFSVQQDDIRPTETGLVLPKRVDMSGHELLPILKDLRDQKITLDKAVEEVRTCTYATTGAIKPAIITEHNDSSKETVSRKRASAKIVKALSRIIAKEDVKSSSSSETTSVAPSVIFGIWWLLPTIIFPGGINQCILLLC
jgi:hypothetical protein